MLLTVDGQEQELNNYGIIEYGDCCDCSGVDIGICSIDMANQVNTIFFLNISFERSCLLCEYGMYVIFC